MYIEFVEVTKFTNKFVLLAILCLSFHIEILLVWHTQKKRPKLRLLILRWLTGLMMKVKCLLVQANLVIISLSHMQMNRMQGMPMEGHILRTLG
ncbi:cytochrome c1-2, heme protein, mitochondrial isoform X1 [Iris pallida]|uniref:Cytochrome c1-2, heme protein, mitochondrial isoform X1 n=1 Tax=Iris pallida TaxID=29817 RepID=A0AAX6J2G2_IRIPA|nr:cytochrome c1-2, heme protein, mitochondrial isoform X1 [Iris pallida]KAJ6854365.1 cytochrome c1-2, heme protein, mitochondrial isoform X1 [Iris pallida]